MIEVPAFAPNHLSADGPRATPVSEVEAARVRDVLRAGWNTTAHVVRRFVTGGTTAANYLIDGRLALKLREDGGALEREVALLRRAGAAGIPVPVLRPSKAGDNLHRLGVEAAALFDFVPGTHFRGLPGELGAAAIAFADVARAFADDRAAPLVAWGAVGSDLRAALAHSPVRADLGAESELTAKAGLLDAALRRDARARLDAAITIHTDFHPLNLLFAQGQIAAVLDFEDLAVAPRAVGAGFALLKLGREALSRAAPADRRALARDLIAEWRAADSSPVMLLGDGARRRVLANILTILEAWRLRGDVTMNHGLAGQIESLAEADFIFDSVD